MIIHISADISFYWVELYIEYIAYQYADEHTAYYIRENFIEYRQEYINGLLNMCTNTSVCVDKIKEDKLYYV